MGSFSMYNTIIDLRISHEKGELAYDLGPDYTASVEMGREENQREKDTA